MQKFILGVVATFFLVTLYALYDIIAASGGRDTETVLRKPAPERSLKKPAEKKERLSTAQKKKRFIAKIRPAVARVKARLDTEYAKALALSTKPERSPEETAWLAEKMQHYNVAGIPCLLRRMHPHPVSLVIAQAALETGWGTSRFYREANNVFGIWSYNTREPRMAAAETRDGKTIYVRKYASLDAAVEGYFYMIANARAYTDFRAARMHTDNPFLLLKHLRKYSELRDEYVARLYAVLRSNRLYAYDDPVHRPIALAEIVPEYVARQNEAAARQILALNEVKMDTPEAATKPCGEENLTSVQAPSTAGPVHSSLP